MNLLITKKLICVKRVNLWQIKLLIITKISNNIKLDINVLIEDFKNNKFNSLTKTKNKFSV
jgi:hypothetical protein